jgi:DNA-binding Lrp family transcriptional regulator
VINMTAKQNIDEEILRLLSKDSRQSYRDLAKQLDISHVSVSNKVKALEEKGIIKGYTTVTDPDMMNYYPLCLRISASQGGNLSVIGDKVADYPDISVVMRVSGDCELLALAMCKDRETALELLDSINEIDGIAKSESHIILEAVKMGGIKLKS